MQRDLIFSGSLISVRIRWKEWILSRNGHKSTLEQNGVYHSSWFTGAGPAPEFMSEPDSSLKHACWKKRAWSSESGVQATRPYPETVGVPLPLSDGHKRELCEWVSNGPSSSVKAWIFHRQLTLKYGLAFLVIPILSFKSRVKIQETLVSVALTPRLYIFLSFHD